jgi:hypothetical protein
MARFRVLLAQTVIERVTVWVEATNKQEAKDLALAQVTTGPGADWRFKDALDGVEVLSVQEITTETQ